MATGHHPVAPSQVYSHIIFAKAVRPGSFQILFQVCAELEREEQRNMLTLPCQTAHLEGSNFHFLFDVNKLLLAR